jgi:glucokinase
MSKPIALGVDIGGTKTLCLLVDHECQILDQAKFKTSPTEGCEEFTKNLLETLRALEKKAHEMGGDLQGIGVGCAGLIDRSKGIIRRCPNVLCLEGFAMGELLQREFQQSVVLENDVQMGVLAEHRLGAAAGCGTVLGIFFGTGVGGAAVIENRLFRGASGMGGQVGALLAQPVGGPEAASSHGIVDRIASKAAITSEALVMAIKEWAPYLHKRVGTDLSKVTWGELKQAIENGDQRIEEMLRARLKVVGIAVSNVVNFLNPDMLVLGGGLVDEMPEIVLPEFEAGLREYLVSEVGEALQVRPAKLGPNAVALGAARIALDR